jgi:hypothetical protein
MSWFDLVVSGTKKGDRFAVALVGGAPMSRRGYAGTDLRTRERCAYRSRRSRGVDCRWMDSVYLMAGGGA